jgi:WD40 repeat protein
LSKFEDIHKFPINNTKFINYESSLCIITSSDDKTSKIIDIETEETKEIIKKKSPIISVLNNENEKIYLISEKSGRNSIYDSRSKNEESEFNTVSSQVDVDWSVSNPNIIACLDYKKFYIYDVRNLKKPVDSKIAHNRGSSKIRISPTNHEVFATCGVYNNLKIWDINTGLRDSIKFDYRCGGLSWIYPIHNLQSCCVVGGNSQIYYNITGL